jgi:hypothetical protein
MDEMDDELIQEQRVLESQMPGLQRVASEESMVSSVPSSLGEDASVSSPPRQRRRIQQTPERPVRFLGTPERSPGPPRGSPGAYTPRNLRRLAYETNPFYEQSFAPVGSAERALEDIMGDDNSSVVTGSSGSDSVDLFGVNANRSKRRSPDPIPLTQLPPGNALFREMSRNNLAKIPEMRAELQRPPPPGALFSDTLKTPDRKKKGGIKSKSKKRKSKRGRVTRKNKRKTRKSKKRKMKKRKTIKKKKKTRR